MVELKILGSGNAFAAGGRFNTCFHIKSTAYSFLLDCGASSIVALRKFGVDISAIDAVVLSHLHGDHMGGVPFVELAGRFTDKRKNPLKVIGPIGTQAAIGSLFKLLFPEAGGSKAEYIEYEAGTTTIDGIEITALEAIHAKETNPHSLRINFNRKVIAFSGDTEWNSNLIHIAKNADIFICECTSYGAATRHMSYLKLVENKAALMAKRIVLTHMDDSMLNLTDCVFERASDGLEIYL
jgi:ribonuclease BN (tRNA processing enzyme)